jgi:hypothetical protein
MGGTLTVCNRSNVPLHVSFDQAGPLYYENFLQPGQCMTRELGRVWFTVIACLASIENAINDGHVAMPIVACVVGSVALTASGV